MSYNFFENKKCEYYPCHEINEINCLFCYCPLYGKANCGGDFKIVKGKKDCSGCIKPHIKENYELIKKELCIV